MNGSGHGQAFISEVVQTAHAAVWAALLGPVGPGVDLHHRCGNPLCVNPLHLQPQTHGNHRREHARERWAHQRADATVHLIGRRPGGKRLNEDEREEIVGLYMTRCATQGQLAHMYGVSRQTINSVIKRARS